MPTYEYRCTECEQLQEAFQKMSDPPLEKCSNCGGKLKRLIGTGSGIIFKGSGFYITDYRSSDYKKKASSESAKTGNKTETVKKSNKKPAKTDNK